jgi:hypothetical protein
MILISPVPITRFEEDEWRVLHCVWHWSADRDINGVRADAAGCNPCRTSDRYRTSGRCSHRAATSPRSRAAIRRAGNGRARGRHRHSFKMAHKLQTTERAWPVRTHRYVVHKRSVVRRATATPAPAAPLVVKTTPEQPSQDGLELFFRQLGKGKE